MSHMATVGVRELQGDARRWLARVRAGEAVVITDRGRPVAKMIPLPEAVGFDALVAEGRIAPGPGRSLDKVLERLDSDFPPDQGSSVSEHLAALRSDER